MAARARRRRVFRQRQAQQSILFTFTLSICLLNCLSTTRTIWAKERSSFWWEYIVNNTFTSHDWITYFRMSRANFMYECIHLRPLITKKETVMRKSISAEKRLAITLYYLATNSDFRTVGHLFSVSKSSVCLIVQEVCATIVDVLLPKHLSFPDFKRITNGTMGVFTCFIKIVHSNRLRPFAMLLNLPAYFKWKCSLCCSCIQMVDQTTGSLT